MGSISSRILFQACKQLRGWFEANQLTFIQADLISKKWTTFLKTIQQRMFDLFTHGH
jgi:hypothetical protein